MADNFVTNPAAGGDTFAADDIGGVKWQRVKIGHGADGSATDVSSASPLPVDTELPAAAALADGASNPTTPLLGSVPLLWNNATLDRQRGNTEGTLLASAARSGGALVSSPNQTNYNGRGTRIIVDVTAKAAATTLGTYVFTANQIGTQTPFLFIHAFAAAANTCAVYDFYPGAVMGDTGAGLGNVAIWKIMGTPLPRTWGLYVYPSDASSVTYSVGYHTFS